MRRIARRTLAVATLTAISGTVLTPVGAYAESLSDRLVAALPRPTCPSDRSPLTPLTGALTAHGGQRYNYRVNGIALDVVIPPAGFAPTTASDAVLREMQLPTRPTSKTALADWTAMSSAYKGVALPRFCWKAPVASDTANPTPRPGDGTAAHYGSSNWAGYVVDGGYAHGGYSEAQAHWGQTNNFPCNCSGPTDEVTWVGLGGYYHPGGVYGLVQDGTRNVNSTKVSWYEYLCGDGCGVDIIQQGATTVNDDISAAVSVRHGDNYVGFGVTDNGVYVVNVHMTLPASYIDLATAEFINERPSFCDQQDASGKCTHSYYKNLTNTGTTTFRGARIRFDSDGSQHYLDTLNPFAVVMTNDGHVGAPPCSDASHPLQYPFGLAANGYFQSAYCRSA